MSALARARLELILAAVLWSTGSLFMRLLREPTGLGWNEPLLTPIQITFYRGLFGGLLMLALVRRADMKWRPMMGAMMLIFTVMSVLYLSALGLGPAANAIFLQNTSPIWVYVFAYFLFGAAGDRRGWQAVALGGLGAVVIVAGNWPRNLPAEEQGAQIAILFMGVGSGIVYAAVMLFLKALSGYSPAWLVSLNLLGTAAMLAIFITIVDGPRGFWLWVSEPTATQFLVFAIYGAVQMAAPYWLFSRGLRTLTPQEAGIITLIEPLLNPLWAYLISPEKDAPTVPMIVGGFLILSALVWRYVPVTSRRSAKLIEHH